MTLALTGESRFLSHPDGPIDYDASDHVAIAFCSLLRRPVPESESARDRISAVVHWSYGSAFATAFEVLRRELDSDATAALVFYAACQSMAFTLFPALGRTPPPWRWNRELLASSIGVHALYALTVAAVARRARTDGPSYAARRRSVAVRS